MKGFTESKPEPDSQTKPDVISLFLNLLSFLCPHRDQVLGGDLWIRGPGVKGSGHTQRSGGLSPHPEEPSLGLGLPQPFPNTRVPSKTGMVLPLIYQLPIPAWGRRLHSAAHSLPQFGEDPLTTDCDGWGAENEKQAGKEKTAWSLFCF